MIRFFQIYDCYIKLFFLKKINYITYKQIYNIILIFPCINLFFVYLITKVRFMRFGSITNLCLILLVDFTAL